MELKNIQNSILKSLKILFLFQKKNKISENMSVCFMLHDEVLDEIYKIELHEFNEWLNDGSFEKTDKLYLSIKIQDF